MFKDNLLSWNEEDPDPCLWQGVRCDADRRVAILILPNQGLIGQISPAIGKLSKLTYIDLHDNYLDGEIPKEIGECISLEIIYLESNSLTGPIPTNLGNLSNLRYLDMSNNKLSGSIPPALGKLSNLLFFNVSNNKLIGRIPTAGALNHFNENSFLGNSLCGRQIDVSCNRKLAKHSASSAFPYGLVGALASVLLISIGAFLVNSFNGNNPQTIIENVDVDANAAGQVQLVEQEVAGDLQVELATDIDVNAAGQVQLVVKTNTQHVHIENVDIDANAAGQVQLVEQEVAGDLQENADVDANAAGQVQLVEQAVAGDLQENVDIDANAAGQVQLVEQEVAGDLQENIDVDANASGQVQLVEQEVAGDLQRELATDVDVNAAGQVQLVVKTNTQHVRIENVDIDPNASGQVQLVEQEVAGDLQGELATDVDVNAAEQVQLVEQEVADELPVEPVEVGSSSFAIDYLEIEWDALRFEEEPLVGRGAFGKVLKAKWHGSDVAVKVLTEKIQDSEIKKFQTEVSIMKSARHPNIVQFMGVVSRFPGPAIVTEFVSSGSLHQTLSGRRLSQGRRLSIALDVARGMNYLHCFKPPIVHLDLKSPNILLDSHCSAKICDFGLARFRADTFIPSKYVAGTPQWSAPEVFKDEPANEKADVYSFGVILWELVTCKEPWSDYDAHQVITAVSLLNERLAIPANTCPELVSLMESCWKESPEQRPTAELIVQTLHDHQRVSGNLKIQ